MNSKPTPGPLRVEIWHGVHQVILDANDNVVAFDVQGNARFIVKACNAHDALVKACNMVFDYDENVHKDVREAIRAALDLAEGSDEN